MTAPLSVFCDECGAANLSSVSICFACRAPLVQSAAAAGSAQKTVQEFVKPASPAASAGSAPLVEPGPGVLLRGRYELIREIGKGGFGVVYLARDKRTRRKVAIKQINIGKLTAREVIDATDSYNRERTLLPGLRNQRLPLLYEHFTDPEHWYLVIEYIPGQTLEEYLQTVPGKALSPKEVRKIGIQLCKVLTYLHEQKHPIIFRDVKPANIMYTPCGKVYLIDFGIARRYSANRLKDTGRLGSPGYAAPEQYGTAQTDARTDIYGLGATLQALLTGADPADAAANTPAPSPGSRLQQRLHLLLAQMLEQESEKRPPSARKVREALEDLPYGSWKFARAFLLGVLWGFAPFLPAIIAFLISIFSNSLPSLFITPPPILGPIFFCLIVALIIAMFAWPFLDIILVILSLVWLFEPRRRLMGLGLLTGLALQVLMIVLHFSVFPPLFYG